MKAIKTLTTLYTREVIQRVIQYLLKSHTKGVETKVTLTGMILYIGIVWVFYDTN